MARAAGPAVAAAPVSGTRGGWTNAGPAG